MGPDPGAWLGRLPGGFVRWWAEALRWLFLLPPKARIGVLEIGMSARTINTLIADDEPIARKLLREELELNPGIAVVAEAENGRDALQKIAKFKPDLVS